MKVCNQNVRTPPLSDVSFSINFSPAFGSSFSSAAFDNFLDICLSVLDFLREIRLKTAGHYNRMHNDKIDLLSIINFITCQLVFPLQICNS